MQAASNSPAEELFFAVRELIDTIARQGPEEFKKKTADFFGRKVTAQNTFTTSLRRLNEACANGTLAIEHYGGGTLSIALFNLTEIEGFLNRLEPARSEEARELIQEIQKLKEHLGPRKVRAPQYPNYPELPRETAPVLSDFVGKLPGQCVFDCPATQRAEIDDNFLRKLLEESKKKASMRLCEATSFTS